MEGCNPLAEMLVEKTEKTGEVTLIGLDGIFAEAADAGTFAQPAGDELIEIIGHEKGAVGHVGHSSWPALAKCKSPVAESGRHSKLWA